MAGCWLGAVVLIVAEFTPLFRVHTAASRAPLESFGTGPHQSYALVPIALLAVALGFVGWREESRSALVAIGLLGAIALLIALVGDLPDAQASGAIRASTGGYVPANSSPALGLYLETLASIVLVISCVGGLLLLGRPASATPDGDDAPGR